MSAGLVWERDGRDWPNWEASRRLRVGSLDWHVQVMGQGPALLLLHGTAASTHSFRDLAPRLASRFTVVAPDLPGHGFTGFPGRAGMSLPGMAANVAALLAALDLAPALAVGHSAGAAVLVRMALDGRIAPGRIVALNGALLPFRGPMAHVAPGMARLLALSSAVPHLVALLAGQDGVRRMLAGMGSRIDRRGLALYARLMRDPAHVRGALAMMAAWDLAELERALPALTVPLTLVVGERDTAVPPQAVEAVRTLLPAAVVHSLPGLGHLAHEERPDLVADVLLGSLDFGVTAPCRA